MRSSSQTRVMRGARALAALSLSGGADDSDTAAGSNAHRSGNGACSGGRWMLSAYPFQLFTSFLGFVVIFRCSAHAHFCRSALPPFLAKGEVC